MEFSYFSRTCANTPQKIRDGPRYVILMDLGSSFLYFVEESCIFILSTDPGDPDPSIPCRGIWNPGVSWIVNFFYCLRS